MAFESRAKSGLREQNQETLLLDHPKIPQGYDLRYAKQAAKRRQRRSKDHRLALKPHTKGFMSRVAGLWIPTSGTENTSVVNIPETKVRWDKQLAQERVYEKYADSDVPETRINLWAFFAGMRAEGDLRKKFRGYMHTPMVRAAYISDALRPFNGEIHREAFTYDETGEYKVPLSGNEVRYDILAYKSVLNYLVNLEAFVGCEEVLGKGERRKWPQLRHVHEYRRRAERAHDMLENVAEPVFIGYVEEAYWSHYSRGMFWTRVNNEYDAYRRARNLKNTEPPQLIVPLEMYEEVASNPTSVTIG